MNLARRNDPLAVVRRARVAVAGPVAGVLVAIIEAPEIALRPDQAMAASWFRPKV